MTQQRALPASSTPDLLRRFWSKVSRTESGCWEWTGQTYRRGYGYLSRINGRSIAAHRLSWEIAGGKIPEGMYVCHACDNPPCVRPSHLWLGTAADNTADAIRKGRIAKWTHCKRGHELTDENSAYVRGQRVCRTCLRASGRERSLRYKARHPDRVTASEHATKARLREARYDSA